MTDLSTAPLVTRGQIAGLAGVRRPAVSNWTRRYAGFPEPVDESGECFDAQEVAAWLDTRKIPADAREPGEGAGASYGQRFRARLAETGESVRDTSAAWKTAEEAVLTAADRLRGSFPVRESLSIVLALVYLSERRPDQWCELVSATDGGDESGISAAVDRACTALDDVSPEGGRVLARLALVDSRELTGVVNTLGAFRKRASAGAPSGAVMIFDRVLDEFARSPGLSSDVITPRSVVQVMTEALALSTRQLRIYDPFCRMGELIAATAARAAAQGHQDTVVTGRTPFPEALLAARMNLAVRGVEGELELARGLSPRIRSGTSAGRFDVVVTNPPFNMGIPGPEVVGGDWLYGPPPKHNANFGWLQDAVAALAPGGSAAVLMTNGAAASARPAEQGIRTAMIEDRTVECLIALPTQLFASTGIGVTVWLLRPPGEAEEEVLFIDARGKGSLVSRTRRELGGTDIGEIAGELRSWRESVRGGRPYLGRAGFSRAVPLSGLRERDHVLHPPAHVGAAPVGTGREEGLARLAGLQERLHGLAERSKGLDAGITDLLKRVI